MAYDVADRRELAEAVTRCDAVCAVQPDSNRTGAAADLLVGAHLCTREEHSTTAFLASNTCMGEAASTG